MQTAFPASQIAFAMSQLACGTLQMVFVASRRACVASQRALAASQRTIVCDGRQECVAMIECHSWKKYFAEKCYETILQSWCLFISIHCIFVFVYRFLRVFVCFFVRISLYEKWRTKTIRKHRYKIRAFTCRTIVLFFFFCRYFGCCVFCSPKRNWTSTFLICRFGGRHRCGRNPCHEAQHALNVYPRSEFTWFVCLLRCFGGRQWGLSKVFSRVSVRVSGYALATLRRRFGNTRWRATDSKRKIKFLWVDLVRWTFVAQWEAAGWPQSRRGGSHEKCEKTNGKAASTFLRK